MYQLLLNNSLFPRVYNKPLIVLFHEVVCTLLVVRGSVVYGHRRMLFYFFVSELKNKLAIPRAFTGTSKLNNSVKRQRIKVK